MPSRPASPCAHPTCPHLQPCPDHPRPTTRWGAHDPFYSSQVWVKARRRQLRDQPRCAVPGCGRAASEVDHIVPVRQDGDRLHPLNLQSLCHEHHREKTQRSARAARHAAHR